MSKRNIRDWMSRAFFARDKATFAQLADEAEDEEQKLVLQKGGNGGGDDEDTGHAEPDGDEGKHPQNVHIHVEHAGGNGGNGDAAIADRVKRLEDGMKGITKVLGRVADKMGIRDADVPPEFKEQQQKGGDGDDDEGEGGDGGKMPDEVREHFEGKSEDSDWGGDVTAGGNISGQGGSSGSGLTMKKPPSSNAELTEADPALEQEKTRMGDAAYKSRKLQAIGGIMRDTLAGAEIIAPGIKVGTLDAGGLDAWPKTQQRLHGLRRAALKKLASTDQGKEIVGRYAASLDAMQYDALRIVFTDAVMRMRHVNNQNNVPSPMFGDIATSARTFRGKQVEIVRGINDANHDYWTKQGIRNMGPRRAA
jgi:hypothetical protein